MPDSILPETEGEHLRTSPTYPLSPKAPEQTPDQAEAPRSTEGTVEIMDMLKTMKKQMEERELQWERQQKIREEFMEATARRKEQIWEENWRLREEEHKQELKRQEEKMMDNTDMHASLLQ